MDQTNSVRAMSPLVYLKKKQGGLALNPLYLYLTGFFLPGWRFFAVFYPAYPAAVTRLFLSRVTDSRVEILKSRVNYNVAG